VGRWQVYRISPKLQKGASIVMPNKLHSWVDTASAAEVGKIQYSCFFPKMFTFRAKLSQVSLVAKGYSVMPLPQELPLHLLLPLYIINLLEVEGAGVSPSKHPAYLAPALCMFCLLFVVFSASPITPIRFIGQACVVHKTTALHCVFSLCFTQDYSAKQFAMHFNNL
jgi:hypothetical protein